MRTASLLRRAALTPKWLAAYLQRDLDVRVDAARIDGVVCGDKRGAGRTARAYVCAYLHDEGGLLCHDQQRLRLTRS